MEKPSIPNGQIVMWILAAVFSLATTFFGWNMAAQNSRMDKLESQVLNMQQPLFSTAENVKNLEDWLNRMESKIDKALDTYRQL